MTKHEILNYFRGINNAYNDCTRFDSLSHMIDELLNEQQETIESLQGTIHKLNAALGEQPEIVRCKDCKHWDKTTREEGNDCISGSWEDAVCDMFRDWDRYGDLGENFRRTNGDWFCADGKRREKP